MELKHINVTNAEGTVYALRLTLGGQKALKKELGKDVLDILMEAVADGEIMAAVLQQALHYAGSTLDFSVTGEEVYNELVDSGYHGQMPWATLSMRLAECSGLITDQQANKLISKFQAVCDGLLESLDDPQKSPEPENH